MNSKELVNRLYTELLSTLLGDLSDSSKCGPGLYQVVRGVIQDNRELLDMIPSDSVSTLQAKISSMSPFKFGGV